MYHKLSPELSPGRYGQDRFNKENNDPYLEFVNKSAAVYSYNEPMPHEWSDTLNVTKFTVPQQRNEEKDTYNWPGRYVHDIPKDLDTIENLKMAVRRYGDPNGEGGTGLEGICSAHLITKPIDPVDHSLDTTPFKNMDYIEMINGFRQQVAENKDRFYDVEKERKNL